MSDHLGSPRRVVNVSDASDVLLDVNHDEFGALTGAGLDSISVGFAGGIFDVDTGPASSSL